MTVFMALKLICINACKMHQLLLSFDFLIYSNLFSSQFTHHKSHKNLLGHFKSVRFSNGIFSLDLKSLNQLMAQRPSKLS